MAVGPGNIIEVEGLTHRYGEVTALEDLSVTFSAGVTGLVGANGAGKTTLLRLMLGLLRPERGTLRVLGHDPQLEALAVRAHIGYMPESECLPRDQTAADFVAYAAQLAGIPPREARRRASEVLYLVGLEEERFRYLGDFSTGMRQRVKLAQAIVHDPDLLLLDEPASGLDPDGRTRMLGLIRRLSSFDMSVIVSSHILSDIEQTCDRVVMLDGGKLRQAGPLTGLDTSGPVVVELLDHFEEVTTLLKAKGLEVAVEGSRLVLGPPDAGLEQAVLEAAATTGAGVLRMERSSASLEDMFTGGP